MPDTQLAYGSQTIRFAFAEGEFEVIATESSSAEPLTDLQIGQAFDRPIESPQIEELVAPGDSVLIVASDATRATASAQLINLLVRRIIQQGISASDLAIVFATGIHRPTTTAEKRELLTPFITQRVRVFDHDAFDEKQLVRLEGSADGTPVEVNRALQEFTHVIITGGIGFHYFAGFTGGRKSICPGLASARTIAATHMLALDFERKGRRPGVGTALLEGNAVNEECERIAALVNPSFAINAIVDEKGRAVRVFAGHWRAAHRQACAQYLHDRSAKIPHKRDLVIVSCGGDPYDINLIQAHKALDMATAACNEGGTIILLAQCRDGLGRADFLKWFEGKDSAALEARLHKSYEVNGQTAWALLSKAERFQVILVSELQDVEVEKMGMTPAPSLTVALSKANSISPGFILPRGAAWLPRLPSSQSVASPLACD